MMNLKTDSLAEFETRRELSNENNVYGKRIQY